LPQEKNNTQKKMTLDNFTPIQKLIFVDAFKAIICDNYYQEEKDFDSEGRLSERRFVYPDGSLKVREAYDYKRSRVTKFFFENNEELLRLTVPLYTYDEQHTMFTPLKERIQQLGFSLENIERLSLSQQCNDPKNLTEQKVLINKSSIYRESFNIENTTYDKEGKSFWKENYESYYLEKSKGRYVFEHTGKIIMEKIFYDICDPSVKFFSYDEKDRLVQEGNLYYEYYHKNKANCMRMYPKKPRKYSEIGYLHTQKKGTFTETTKCITEFGKTEKIVSTLNQNHQLVRKVDTTYCNYGKNKKRYRPRKKDIINETIEQNTYNVAGLLVKREYTLFYDDESQIDSYSVETFNYNEQGQIVERNEKTEYKNGFGPKYKIFLEQTLYYYDSEGNLTREELKKWRADEGIETDIEYLTTHHFYVEDDEYKEHLKVTVKK
jgi:hypothetical protein